MCNIVLLLCNIVYYIVYNHRGIQRGACEWRTLRKKNDNSFVQMVNMMLYHV